MFNYDGVRSSQYTAPIQILANVEFQYSVGCRVPQSLGVDVTANGVTRKIAKAGTPIVINFGKPKQILTNVLRIVVHDELCVDRIFYVQLNEGHE